MADISVSDTLQGVCFFMPTPTEKTEQVILNELNGSGQQQYTEQEIATVFSGYGQHQARDNLSTGSVWVREQQITRYCLCSMIDNLWYN